MTRIPHGTCQEKRYADYLEDFARQRGLSFVRDAMDNVVIYQKGTPGYENLPAGDSPGPHRHGVRKKSGLRPQF